MVARFFFPPSWFKSSGVLVIGRAEEESEANWETVVVVTLLVVLRREREWRYALAGNVFPMKRTFV